MYKKDHVACLIVSMCEDSGCCWWWKRKG